MNFFYKCCCPVLSPEGLDISFLRFRSSSVGAIPRLLSHAILFKNLPLLKILFFVPRPHFHQQKCLILLNALSVIVSFWRLPLFFHLLVFFSLNLARFFSALVRGSPGFLAAMEPVKNLLGRMASMAPFPHPHLFFSSILQSGLFFLSAFS